MVNATGWAITTAAPAGGKIPEPVPGLSVNELILAYLTFAERYYRGQDGKPSREYEQQREAAKLLRRAAGRLPAQEFGPKKLKGLRDDMILRRLSRKHINQQVRRIVVVFRWGCEEELLAADLNNDGFVGGADLSIWESAYGSSDAGDVDFDGDADGGDFLT
ncbi:MAG: hypothetical protein IH898_06825 [Planctomycetes bacterium]|nr:hypothetical protein [Planctomycetota bacterium]